MERLQQRIIISLASSYISQFGSAAGEIATKLVLARLIIPAQWGVFAEAMLVVLTADVFTDFGLSQHIFREKQRPFGNVLLIRVAFSIITIGFIEFFTPLFRFLSPEIITPLRVLAPLILIKAIGAVPTVFVDRELMVHRSLIPQFTKLGTMAAVSIWLAALDMGIWALIIGTLASETVYTTLMWLSVRKSIEIEFTLRYSRLLLSGSSYLFVIALVGLLLQQGDIFVTGTLLTPGIVGLYSMALMINQRLSKLVETAIYRIIYPVFCEYQHDTNKMGQVYKFTTLAIIAIEAPLYLFLLFHSGFFVSILLGSKWMSMAVILQALSLSGIINPFATFGIEVLKATKRDATIFTASAAQAAAVVIAGFVLTSQFGVMGMVAANYLPVSSVLVAVSLIGIFPGHFKDLSKKLAVVYILSFALSASAYLLTASKAGRAAAGVLTVIVLWLIFYKLYGITVGKETLKHLQ